MKRTRMMGKRIYMRVPAFLLAGILAALGPSVPAAAAQQETERFRLRHRQRERMHLWRRRRQITGR